MKFGCTASNSCSETGAEGTDITGGKEKRFCIAYRQPVFYVVKVVATQGDMLTKMSAVQWFT